MLQARSAVMAFVAILIMGSAVVNAPAAAAQSNPPTVQPACTHAAPGQMRCFALIRNDRVGRTNGTAPAGFGPADLQSAYHLPSAAAGNGQTIAIVDAFDDPNAESDLAVYRSTYGLPACTAANGCFRKLNQRGEAGPYPQADPGWAVEISLDVEMVSAVCPLCHIVLVEADQADESSLGAAEDAAAAAVGVSVISNSWGGDEYNGMAGFARHFHHPGVAITASSGDFGFRTAQFPAVLTGVIAVGGTSLTKSTNARGWSEKVWSGSGSGCSAYVAKPSWQHDAHCHMRTVADVSAVADPYATGLAVYDTFFQSGWLIVGGTSASSPLIAGVIGLAGNGAQLTPAFPYAHMSGLWDVVGGSNGFCGGDYLCTGKRGYDAPTGLGTPHGMAAL